MFKYLLIWRYFVKKRVTLIAVVAVTLLVMMVLVVLSVMSGLLNEVRHKNHRWCGDIVISRDSLVGFPYYQEFIDELAKSPLAQAATPVIRTFGMNSHRNSGQIFGVRLDEFCRVTGFAKTLRFQTGDKIPSFEVPDIVGANEQLIAEQKKRGCIIGARTQSRLLIEEDLVWDGNNFHMRRPIGITVFGIDSICVGRSASRCLA